MTVSITKILGWMILYIGLALVPMALALGIDRPAARSFLIELGALLGLLGIGVLGMQLVISGRHPWFAGAVGQDNLLQFHRQMGLFAWLLVLAHPITLFVANPEFLEYLNPGADLMRASSLIFVLLATTLLIASSLWREGMKLQYEWWRALHGILSMLVVAAGLGHALLVDHYTGDLLTKMAIGAFISFTLLLLFESRLFRPWRLKRKPWEVVDASQEQGDATRLVLEAQGHWGMSFKPGQYAWITLGDSPFSLQQHPFSIDSDATRPHRLEFTAKHAGDFTNSLRQVKVGTRAWIEGPYGVFSVDPSSGNPVVFIAGGVGITPIMSMLRSCRALEFSQPMLLLYANSDYDSILFRESLNELSQELALKVIHVLQDPPEDWDGESGLIDADLLERLLPKEDGKIDYFVCGPPPLMDQVEPALRKRGAPIKNIHSERFNLV